MQTLYIAIISIFYISFNLHVIENYYTKQYNYFTYEKIVFSLKTFTLKIQKEITKDNIDDILHKLNDFTFVKFPYKNGFLSGL